jgi:integrase
MKPNATKRAGERFTIATFINPSGATAYRVQGRKADGTRVRVNFRTEAEAEGERQRLTIAEDNREASVRLEQTTLTPPQLRDAEWSFSELGTRSIRAAVRFYLDNYSEPVTTRGMVEAFREFIASKESENARLHTLRNLRIRVGRFANLHRNRSVAEILPEHVRDFAFKAGCKPSTVKNNRRAVFNFLAWCVKRGYASSNPAEQIEPPHVDDPEPEILTLDECRKLAKAAASYRDGMLLPWTVLALFAGIRPTELSRLTWNDVNLDGATVIIQGKAAKLRQRRTVNLEPNVVAWLRPFALAQPAIKPENWTKLFNEVKTQVGFGTPTAEQPDLKRWPVDVLRHTAISMHFAQHEHEGKTASWAGNSPTMVHRHYKGLVSKETAKAFWSIAPDAKKPVRMPKRHAAAVNQ